MLPFATPAQCSFLVFPKGARDGLIYLQDTAELRVEDLQRDAERMGQADNLIIQNASLLVLNARENRTREAYAAYLQPGR